MARSGSVSRSTFKFEDNLTFEIKVEDQLQVGGHLEGDYYHCDMLDGHNRISSNHYVCQKVTLDEPFFRWYRFAVRSTSKNILRVYGLIESKGIPYLVCEKFLCTLKTWVSQKQVTKSNGAGVDDKLADFIRDTDGVEDLHTTFKVQHGNIDTDNIFIVENGSGRPTAKLGNINAEPLLITPTKDELQIEELKKDDHQSVWDMLDNEVFNGKNLLIELHHFVKELPRRCTCKQFSFYRHHHVLMDESQRCGFRHYSENSNNYSTEKVMDLDDAINMIASQNNYRRENSTWKTKVTHPQLLALKYFLSYGSKPSDFLHFSRAVVGHVNKLKKLKRTGHVLQTPWLSFVVIDQELNSIWPDFMNLLFDACLEANLWFFTPSQQCKV